MAAFNFFDAFMLEVNQGHDLAADQLRVALTDTAPDAASDTVIGDIVEVDYSFLSSRNITTTSFTQTGAEAKLIVADLLLTSSGGQTPTFQYVVVYNVASGKLIGYYDRGSSTTIEDTESLEIIFGGSSGLVVINPA